jgi:hypothetical protein
MVYNAWNYWGFGLCSYLLKGSISVVQVDSNRFWQRCMTLGIAGFLDFVLWLRLALSNGPNGVGVFHPLSGDGNRSSFQNIVFLRIPHEGQSPKKNSNPECYEFAFGSPHLCWSRIFGYTRLWLGNVTFFLYKSMT